MLAIGAGRIGTALRDLAATHELPLTLIERDRGWEALDEPAGDPIVVCVRNDDLAAVVARVPESRRIDLVFVQNGAMREFLASWYLPHATRGVLYFAVPAKGAPIEIGYDSPFCGAHAAYVSRWLAEAKVPAREVDWARFSLYELEKMIWIAAFGALGDAYGEDVGTISATRPTELAALADELRTVGRAVMGVDIELDFLMKRLCGYADRIPRFRAGVRELAWRNGWFVQKAIDFQLAHATHLGLLRAGGHWPA